MGFLAWLNKRNLVGLRSVIVYVTLYITYKAFEWSISYATTSPYDALGTAAVMGAVTGPVSVLLGAVAAIYTSSKAHDA